MHRFLALAGFILFFASLFLGYAANKRRITTSRRAWLRVNYGPGGWRLWFLSATCITIAVILETIFWLPDLLGH